MIASLTEHSVRWILKCQRSPFFSLLLIVAIGFSLFPKARPAFAAASPARGVAQTTGEIDPCDLVPIPPGVNCTNYPPPELLYLEQGGIFAATPNQTASLRNLEQQAVSSVIAIHGLSTSDTDAVKSWARDDALAQLYLMLLTALDTSSTERTADQQNAVDWLTAVAQRQNINAAEAAGREYVKWAGLDVGNYDALLRTGPSESTLKAFLSGTPLNYNNTDTALATGGWCKYRSPAPYESEYTGYTDIRCSSPTFAFTFPPTPTYDNLVKWGQASATYPLLSSGSYADTAKRIQEGLTAGLPVAAIAAGAIPAFVVASAIASEITLSALLTTSASLSSALAGAAFTAVTGLGLALVIIAAFAVLIITGINVTDAAQLPDKLAKLVIEARTTPPDISTFDSDSDTATSLYSMFVGAVVPAPSPTKCDNSTLSLPPGYYPLTINGTVRLTSSVPCLNPTKIAPAAATDPQFLVKAKQATAASLAPTITWKETSSGNVSVARLSGNWFVTTSNGVTGQQLRITYTNWDGKKKHSWLAGNPDDGYAFVSYVEDSTATLDPLTCFEDGICDFDPTIYYIGADGQKYSATVRGYQAPTGAPTVTGATESNPATLDANGFAPGGAVEPVTYRWSFKGSDCALYIGIPCPELASATGATATYTWDAPGTYQVDLTATDGVGAQATTSLQVTVASVPPIFALAPDCANSPNVPCNTWSGSVGSSVAVRSILRYTGSASRFQLTVDWGDGTTYFATIGSDGSVGTFPPGGISQVTVTRVPGELAYTILAPYTYANPGVYNGTITVKKIFGLLGDGGTVSRPFTMNIKGNQTISFPGIGGTSYGNVFPISATGGASGQPVTFTSNNACTLSNVSGGAGTGSATVTVVSAGTCIITARQAGSATYNPAPEVTRQIISLLAVLTVTAPSPTITYGQPVPALTPEYSGFRLSDTTATLTTPATCAVAPNSGGVGSYAITCSGAAAPNYSTDYVAGTLTINRAPLTITANNKSMFFGQAIPSFDATFDGLVNGESSSVVNGLSCSARDASGQAIGSGAPVGSYPITCTGGSAANYSLSYVAGTLSINKAATTTSVSATPSSSLLGQAVTFTATVAVTSPGSGTPSGVVSFTSGGAPIAGCTAQPVDASGKATCTTAALGVGQRTISASYSGDANFAASSAAPASYTVAYGFSNFAAPVDSPPTVNTASAGRIIPLKWRVVDAAGNPITNLSSVSVTSVVGGCSASAPADTLEEYAGTSSGLQNLGDGYYQFNWKTERAWAGSCRTLRLDLGDGVVRTALFQFR